MGERLRINAQLIDGTDGRHVWAERYDGDMAEIFEFQDAIREQIVSALRVSLTPTDKALTERKPTDSVEAYDLFLRGRANFYNTTREHTLEAVKCFEEAIEIDLNFADAYASLAFCHFYGWFHMWPEFDDTLDRAYEFAKRGAALDSKSAVAVMRLGFIEYWMRRFDQAIPNFEKATALAPNNAEVCVQLGQMLNYWGDPERGMEMIEKALSLETFAPAMWEFYAGCSRLLLNRYDEAITILKRVTEQSPKFSPAHFSLAWAYVELGRLDDAHDEIEAVFRINSQYTLKEVDRLYPYRIDAVRNRFLDSLRKAGLPEGDEVEDELLQLPDKPSIAVLPFDNMSDDADQEYFSDGLAEDLITDLSKISGLFVVARNSAFAYKGQPIDVRRVAEELGVRHVLEGSVRKAGGKVRINAQLIDAQTGGHIWADRYDGDLEDIFSLQDTITAQIVSALQVTLTSTDKALTERKPTDSVEAYDLFLKGRANFYNFAPEHMLQAKECFEAAIEIDPNFGDAYAYLSYCHFVGWVHMRPGFDNGLNQSYELAQRGVALDDTSAHALAALGHVQTVLGHAAQGIKNSEKATALAANDVQVLAALGQSLNRVGNPERGLEILDKAIGMETVVPPSVEYYAGLSHLLLRHYDDALAYLQRTAERAPKFIPTYPLLAWAYVELGRPSDARGAIKTFLELVPQFTVKKAAERWSYGSDEDHERFLDALLKAGLPEG
jgi:TolB-like protein/Flp pilus assembly protein TadD